MLNRPQKQSRSSALVATLLPFLMMFGWCLVIPVAWAVIGRILPGSAAFDRTYEVLLLFGTPILPFELVILAALATSSALVLVRWLTRRTRLAGTPDLRRVADDGARLIVAPWLLGAIAVGYVFFEAVTLTGYLSALMKLPEPDWLKAMRSWLGPSSGPVLAFLAAVLPLLLSQFVPYLRSGLDLIYDVINHFHFRFRDIPDPRTLTRADDPDFPVRHAIQHRLSAALAHFAGRLAGPDQPPCGLVILSHSQGTVVAIDVLNDPAHNAAFGRSASVRLVTMGSPFSHIYQHYFRHHYPEL